MCILVRPKHETLMHYFSFPCGPGVGPTRSAPQHVTPSLCVCNRCDLWITYYVEVHPGHEISMHYFSCLGGPCADPTKIMMGHILPNLCFASDAIYKSHFAF
jgi:hypothetical protein